MSTRTKKIIIIYVSLVAVLSIVLVLFSILGSKERIGYLQISETDAQAIYNSPLVVKPEDSLDNEQLDVSEYLSEPSEYTYSISVEYYNEKIFRSSDIFGVYLNADSLPKYILCKR